METRLRERITCIPIRCGTSDRIARQPVGRHAVSAVGRPADQAGRARRLGQPDLPPRRADDRAAAQRRALCGAGGEGTALAAQAGAAPAAADPGPAGDGAAGRRLSLALVRLSLARRRDGDASSGSPTSASSRSTWPSSSSPCSGSMPRTGRRRAAQLLPRRAAGDLRRRDAAGDRRARRARSTPAPRPRSGTRRWRRRWHGSTGLGPRRRRRRQPAGDGGGSAPSSTSAVPAWAIPPAIWRSPGRSSTGKAARRLPRGASARPDATWARGRGWTLWKALITLAALPAPRPSGKRRAASSTTSWPTIASAA